MEHFHRREGDEYGGSIIIDNNDNIYVTGQSNKGWSTLVNDHVGQWDTFVGKPRTTPCTLIIFKKKNGKSIPMCL